MLALLTALLMAAAQHITLDYAPREFQREIHRGVTEVRFNVAVVHRQGGKTEAALQECVKRALMTRRENVRVGYIAPTYRQVKDVAWVRLQKIVAPIPGVKVHESELYIELPGGARRLLAGAENYDALRGVYWDVVLDEVAQMASPVWPEVVRPALSARDGRALFIGTPDGLNHFHDHYAYAASGVDPEWRAHLYRWNDTNVLGLAEIESARRTQSPEQFAREYECSFTAAVRGSYYGKLLDAAEAEGRVTRVVWEPRLPVTTAWDLGWADSTAVWLVQTVGNEVRIIRYVEETQQPLRYYANLLRGYGYTFGQHLAPHDASAHELIAGASREETMRGLGFPLRVLPAVKHADQIEAVRTLLPRCVFDRESCADGLAALRNYRADFNTRTDENKPTPLHDWSSHGASAFAQLAVGLRAPSVVKRPKAKPNTRWVV